MRVIFPVGRLAICSAAVLSLSLAAPQPLRAAPPKNKSHPPTLRWSEDRPGCTFARDDDGKYRYALWTADYGVILAVDSQELEMTHRRVEPFFSVHLTVRYGGKSSLVVNPAAATLEFVRHFKLIQPALDPEGFADRVQADAGALEHETEHETRRHPERKPEREKFVQTYQKEVAELLDFLTRHSLMSNTLDSAHPEASGWLLFSTQSKWLGDWKKPEEFVLRLPLDDRVVEFPFVLPVKQGDLILRKRPD
jgi:hypothetical protein